MEKKSFVLFTTIHIKTGCEKELLSVVSLVNAWTRLKSTFFSTVLHRSHEDPSLFTLYETWLDPEDFFSVQMKQPYRDAYDTSAGIAEASLESTWSSMRLLDSID